MFKYIKFNTNQELHDFIPTVVKKGFKVDGLQMILGINRQDTFITFMDDKRYITLTELPFGCKFEQITPQQFIKENNMETRKIYRDKNDGEFIRVWSIEGVDGHVVRSYSSSIISSVFLNKPFELLTLVQLEDSYVPYNPQETIEINGKKYKASEVEERLAELKEVE